jgi:hypothetical protein
MSEPSAAMSIGQHATTSAATTPTRTPATRRPSSPVRATVAVPTIAPTSWRSVWLPNPIRWATLSTIGHNGGNVAVGTCSPRR